MKFTAIIFTIWLALIAVLGMSYGRTTKQIHDTELQTEMKESLVLTNGYVGYDIQKFNILMMNRETK